jgi:chaperone modulatory protein CbpM
MTDHSIQVRVTGFILEDQTELTLGDICRACGAETPLIVEMVDEGVLAPSGEAPAQWRFTGVHIQRARTALSLQRDLGVNLAGAALAIQLIEELESLRAQLHRLSGD